jgi:hypothetical protein
MKRNIIAFMFALVAALGVYGQSGGSIDLILLLDTSSSMISSYQDVNNYISGGFLREFLRTGDTFHLIPFSDRPRLDISRRIEGQGDVETIIGRMFLQYPLEPFSDIQAAMRFAEQYVSTLPASRPKKIVLVSDGISSSVPGSSSPAIDAAGTRNLVGEAQARFAGRNVSLDFVQVTPGQPLANLPASGRPRSVPPKVQVPVAQAAPPKAQASPASGQTAPAAQAPPPSASAQTTPAQSAPPPARTPPPVEPSAPPASAPAQTTPLPARTPPAASAPAQTTPPPARTAPPEREPVTPPPVWNEAPQPSRDVPPAEAAPPAGIQTPGQAADTPPVEPPGQNAPETALSGDTPAAAGETSPALPEPARPQAVPDAEDEGLPLPLFIGLGILALFAIGLVVFFVSRQFQGSPNRAMAQAASPRSRSANDELAPFVDHSKDLANFAANRQSRTRSTPYVNQKPDNPQPELTGSGPLLLNLFVEDQNTGIGKRNVHALKPGYRFTIGGGKSDFLIFLVPIPQAIGEVRRDGNRCTFIPRKSKYFPDLESKELPDCIGKTIRVISDKNYEIRFRLERYEDPLAVLNRALNAVKVPG